MHMSVSNRMYVCALHACQLPTDVRRTILDSLELELQMTVSHHMVAGN